MPSKQNRRKQEFVNARVQGRIIARVAGYWLLGLFVLLNGLFVFRYALLRVASSEELVLPPMRSLYGQFWLDYSPFVVSALLIMPVLMLEFVRLTHRVVGPLVRIQTALQELMNGDHLSQVKFRDNDLLNEFEATFNQFLAYYNQQLAAPGGSAPDRSPSSCGNKLTEAQARAVSSVVSTTPTSAVSAAV
jgi:hypothetical protein